MTVSGNVIAVDLDISGDVDIDGTLEADAITVNGTTLAETISDTVGAMVGSNTETGISVTYDDSDNTLDFVLGSAQTTITSLLATDIKIGEDDETKIDFETADQINFYADNTKRVTIDSTGLTVNSGSIETATIDFTDGDNAITIADGGGITTIGDATVTGNLSLGGSNTELRFMEGSNYVGFEAPALTGNQIWVLPASDGTANQVIQTDGSGNLSFATATAGATGGGTDQIFFENSRTVTTNYTITSGKSAHCVGAITISSGITLTIPSNERLVIL